MKTIQEAAAAYAAQEERVTRSEHVAFVAGAEFAQRWIGVEEELPLPHSEYIHTSLYVLVKTDIEFVRMATYNHHKHGWMTERGKGLDVDLGKVTHWQQHYSGYTEQDLGQLLSLLSTIKGKFILSNYWCDVLHEYVKQQKWNFKEIEVDIRVSNLGRGEARKKITQYRTEVLIYNYDILKSLFSDQ
jgi:hypothetical protein